MSFPRTWLMLFLTAALVAAGCGGGAEEGGADSGEGAATSAQTSGADAASVAPIQILINDSPWFSGFAAAVEAYTAQTGNEITLDVTPYGGMLTKARNAMQQSESAYDLVNIDTGWTVEFYEADTLTPLAEIDPDFELPEEVLTQGESYFWNEEIGWRTAEGGQLMTVPPNINIHLTFYRSDLYEEAGLEAPETWEDALAACEAIQKRPDLYGYVLRGERGNPIRFNWTPVMLGHGASIVADPQNGDYTVTINSPEAKAALDLYVRLANDCGPENTGALGQSDLVGLMTAGRALQAHIVVAAWAQMDNPDQSAVVGLVDTVPVLYPEGGEQVSVIGNWHLGIPRNLPDERKQAALEFLKWFVTFDAQMLYAEGGALPIRSDVFTSDLAEEEEFRYFPAYLEGMQNAVQVLGYREGAQVEEVLGLRLNQAVIGELSPAQALNTAAEEIHQIFQASGRDTGMLEPLPEG